MLSQHKENKCLSKWLRVACLNIFSNESWDNLLLPALTIHQDEMSVFRCTVYLSTSPEEHAVVMFDETDKEPTTSVSKLAYGHSYTCSSFHLVCPKENTLRHRCSEFMFTLFF